jgi:hypothetical protein
MEPRPLFVLSGSDHIVKIFLVMGQLNEILVKIYAKDFQIVKKLYSEFQLFEAREIKGFYWSPDQYGVKGLSELEQMILEGEDTESIDEVSVLVWDDRSSDHVPLSKLGADKALEILFEILNDTDEGLSSLLLVGDVLKGEERKLPDEIEAFLLSLEEEEGDPECISLEEIDLEVWEVEDLNF